MAGWDEGVVPVTACAGIPLPVCDEDPGAVAEACTAHGNALTVTRVVSEANTRLDECGVSCAGHGDVERIARQVMMMPPSQQYMTFLSLGRESQCCPNVCSFYFGLSDAAFRAT